ncbi:MAG: exodeoxyribonuclease V subunit beta [Methylophagaceae bacterium]
MTSFDSNTVLLEGLNLIEASAGTGKTYTLAELYLRLLLEKNYTVDQILVVTYTRAATEELRDRLRNKLVDARDDLRKNPEKRESLKTIVEPDEVRLVSQKLTLAIQSFDEASIFTIHGFCQRVLSDFAFESSQRFEVELIGDDLELLQSITDDFWRREVTTANKEFVAYLLSKNETPESLLKSVRHLIAKPYLNYLAVPEVDLEQCSQQAQLQFSQVKELWQQEQESVISCLEDNTLLRAKNYRSDWVRNWLLMLNELLSLSDVPDEIFEQFDRFTPVRLNSALHDNKVLPDLMFWSACESLLEQYQRLQQARELQRQQLRVSLLEYLQETVPKRKQQQQILSYDDLLLNLQQALDGQQGDWLINRLRQQYPAALIDEFQDTDPIQYASFSRIYADSGLATFLVGDPKQAIYSFRGADIFTYLEAKTAADKEHTLTKNWRSHPDLVTAINTIFNQQKSPFIYQNIPFYSVSSAREDEQVLNINGGSSAPLQILWSDNDKAMTKADMTELSANVTADQIAQLLNLSQMGNATLFDSKNKQKYAVSGGDIAVLVRNHKQAHAIQSGLQQRGINSVQQGRENVFNSPEAQMLQRVILAIAEPNNEARIKSALVTKLWGLTAVELYQLQQDDSKWLQQLNLFFECHQVWLKHGFMRAFRQLLNAISAQQHLLTMSDGDRQLTNLLHLAELVQDYCSHHNDGVESVSQWLSTRRQSIDPNDETGQLRLESDEQLVKIITIHKSKGLEYSIVFCPFLWDANLRSARDNVISFHQPEQDNTACVAFSEPELTEAKQWVTTEEKAEDLRLLYVALTRARERCVIVWGNVKGKQEGMHVSNTALFSLLHPNSDNASSETMRNDLNEVVNASQNTISIQDINVDETVHYRSQDDNSLTLAAKKFRGVIHSPWRIGSFSALTSGHDAELPDYDGDTSFVVSLSSHELDPILRQAQDERSLYPKTQMGRFSFPRGAQAGTCLHAIFEHWDFASDDQQAMQKLVSKTLLQYGFDDKKWSTVVCQWIHETLATPLNEQGLVLENLALEQRLDELEFYFPVANLTVKKLQQALLPLLADDSPLSAVLKRLNFFDLTGFMKGFIDLVFEYQGRFYIVDYKSNHLGNSEQDYQSEALNEAMIAHDYPLQYLIYSLALHRYLKLRLPNYDPEQHLGGAYYLFIRGMKPEWNQAGIFYDKPSKALLEALDQCLKGTSDE